MAEAEVPDAQWPVFLDKNCDLCEINDIEFKCLNCDELLCDSCKKIHLKSKMTKNHKVVCLETAEVYQSNESETKCPIHPTEDLLMYCGTCKCPICRDCIASATHHNHQMVKIENVIDNMETKLIELINESKYISLKYDEAVKTIDKNSQEFSLDVSQEIEQVKARNNLLKSKLDKIESDCIRQLKDADDKNKKAMTEMKQRLQCEVTDLNNMIQQCEVKQKNRNIELVQFVTDVTQRLDQYKSYDLLETLSSPPNLIRREVDDDVLKILFGYLDTTLKNDQLLPQKKNISSASHALDAKIVSSFTSTNGRVVAVDNDHAWLWSRTNKGISLITSDGKVIQNINTNFRLFDAAVSTSGDLLVTEYGGNTVNRLTSYNTFTDIYTADDHETLGITVTDTMNIFVGLYKRYDSKIIEIRTSGQHIRTIQHDTVDNKLLFNKPKSICTNIFGDIIVVDDDSRVVSVNKSGTKRFIYGGKERKIEKLFSPHCVVTDKYGNIIITDCSNSKVHMINQDGKFLQYLITRKHGCDCPRGISIDTSGRLWIWNKGSGEVFIVKYL